MMNSNQKRLAMPLFACSALFLSSANASEFCAKLENGCESPTGWYVGGELGRSSSDFDMDRLNELATAGGLNVTSATIDDEGTSRGLIFGYQFNPYFAVEGGFRDLGDFSSDISGTTTDPAQFNQIASTLVPQSGDGGSLGIILSYPFSKGWKLSGKIGMWNWENENDITASTTVADPSGSEIDIYYGAEASYQLTNRWQTYFSAVRYEFDRDQANSLSLGVRYFFGGDNKSSRSSTSRAKPAPAPQPAKAAPAPEPVKTATAPKDSDGDGVYDDKDRCAGTPRNHVVDGMGCTVYEEVEYQHQLVINYPNNSSVIDASYLAKIQELVDFAKDNSIKYLQVVGHTSAPGTEEYNQWLSEERAKSLQTILVERHGYSDDQIETVGKGELQPIAQGDTETAYAKNRRIEVNLSATGKNPKTK